MRMVPSADFYAKCIKNIHDGWKSVPPVVRQPNDPIQKFLPDRRRRIWYYPFVHWTARAELFRHNHWKVAPGLEDVYDDSNNTFARKDAIRKNYTMIFVHCSSYRRG